MSHTFTLVGTSSVLSANYYPPIELNTNLNYNLALIGFHTYNSIPNIEAGVNNLFHFNITSENNNVEKKVIEIPEGSYEITDIESYLLNQLSILFPQTKENQDELLSLKANNNTIKVEIKSDLLEIDFTHEASIACLLGFTKKVLTTKQLHESDAAVDIIKVTSIRLECNLVSSSHYDSLQSHTLYEFTPSVEPGFALNIEPQHVLYLPVNVKESINNITIRVLDQNGCLVNFRGEKIIIRLELKANGNSF
jgi:hypothetical protein